ncbi:MAG TPA: peptidylprolyl isomerase [Candidatus Thermoplasmatota archaeon]|nr:peptidylprolyl isomerase [Candidatus Thermoplasmatota archaeon]
MANPRAIIETSAGTIVCELYGDKAPTTVANFVKYANDGFFAGTIFHRVIKDFVIQGGGIQPNGRQKETPYPPIKLEIVPGLKHLDGALSMARTNVRDSATSQFYICHGPQPSLDNNYAVFGKVLEGMEVVRAIATAPTDRSERPRTDVFIRGVKVQ